MSFYSDRAQELQFAKLLEDIDPTDLMAPLEINLADISKLDLDTIISVAAWVCINGPLGMDVESTFTHLKERGQITIRSLFSHKDGNVKISNKTWKGLCEHVKVLIKKHISDWETKFEKSWMMQKEKDLWPNGYKSEAQLKAEAAAKSSA